jgi:hypothetical protein
MKLSLSLVLLSVAASAFADVAHQPAKRDHHHVAAVHKRNGTEVAKRDEAGHLVKRESFTGTATWYDVTPNAGACGDWMQKSDYVVALNSPQLNAYGGYQNGKPASCYKSITIQANGQTANARIMDECPPCAWGSLDLSESLFQHFAGLDAGVFQLTWWFNDGSGGGGEQPHTTTTQEYTPPPQTTTSTNHETTTTSPTSTTPTTTSPTTTPSSSTTTGTDTSNSIQEVPETTPAENLQKVQSAVIGLAKFIDIAAGL